MGSPYRSQTVCLSLFQMTAPVRTKRLAFPSKESVYVDVGRLSMTGGHPFAPSIASIRGSSW